MLELITLIVFCFVSRVTIADDLQQNINGEVIFVNVLFRHGDRNIIRPYANDPNKDMSNWPEGLAQLTNIGKRQEYALGEWLRQRYDRLLTDQYSPQVVHVRSTDVDRTLMSAKCVLAAVYPPHGAQVWNRDLPWQPIPVHTIPEVLDKVLANKYPCPVYDQELKKVEESTEITNLTAKYSDVIKVLKENSGENVTSLHDINFMYHDLYIEKLKNLTVPEWAEGLFPAMHEASGYWFAVPTWNTKLARLKSGLLVQELINNMKAKRDGTTSLNVNMYSAHDSTVANLLNTLGVYDLHVPPYSACVVMELRVDDEGRHVVTLYYRNSTTEDPYLLVVPGCTPACPLDQLITLTLPVIPQDWGKECQLE